MKGDELNPRVLAEYETIKSQLTYKNRLCKFYYDRLHNMMGEDSFVKMMKEFDISLSSEILMIGGEKNKERMNKKIEDTFKLECSRCTTNCYPPKR